MDAVRMRGAGLRMRPQANAGEGTIYVVHECGHIVDRKTRGAIGLAMPPTER